MPLKVNVGLSRKVGEANYGSRGASVHVEVELDAGLAADPPRLQEKIRLLFDLARASVAAELHGAEVNNGHGPSPNGTRTNAAAGNQPANGHVTGTGINNGNGTSRRTVPRSATQSQVKALARLSPGPLAGPSCPGRGEDDPTWEAAVGLPSLFHSRGSMNARTKLNRHVVLGILIAAAGIGMLTGSWVVFLLAALILAGLALHDGSLRPSPRGRRFR